MENATKQHKSIVGLLLKYGIPLVVSIGLCWLLFRNVDLAAMWHTIRTKCHFEWIALMLGLSVFSHVFRAMRWRIQLRALGINPPLFAVVLSIFGTYAVNLVFPRLGEVWRTGYIANRQQAPFVQVFGSMVADRLADTITVALLTLTTFIIASQTLLSYLSQSSDTLNSLVALITSPWLWLGFIIAAALLWIFFVRCANSIIVVKIKDVFKGLWDGFSVVITMPGKGRFLLLTLAIWGCYFTQMFVSLFAFDFTAEIVAEHGIVAVLVTFVLSSISMGVPSNGGIGPWQWAVIFSLGIYGLATEPAATFANLALGCTTLSQIALGLFTFVAVAMDRRHGNNSESKKPYKKI